MPAPYHTQIDLHTTPEPIVVEGFSYKIVEYVEQANLRMAFAYIECS